ncbi:Retrovirus-related Pol polyprotein from transposon RE1-like protein, partial [Drosera capensis]
FRAIFVCGLSDFVLPCCLSDSAATTSGQSSYSYVFIFFLDFRSFHGGDFAYGYLLAPTFFSGPYHDVVVGFSQITSQRIYTDQIIPPPSPTVFTTTSEGFPPQFYHSSSSVAPLIPNVCYTQPSVKSVVTITLSVVENYLVWCVQMKSFIMSYGFIGFMDGSIASPPMHLLQASSEPVLNPDYFQWQRIDQMVRSWIFATLSHDILVEVLNLKLAREIWNRLHHRFMSVCMARSIQLKRKLTSHRKASSDSMEKYHRDIKILADSLAAINSPVFNADLIEHTLMGLGTEYESLIAVVMNAPIAPSFDDIRSKLLLHEQCLKFLSSADLLQHQAFAVAPRSSGDRPSSLPDRSGMTSCSSSVSSMSTITFPSYFTNPVGSRVVPFVGLSHNNVVCQICYQTSHPASTCPSRYAPQSVQAFATGLTGGSNEAVWSNTPLGPSKGCVYPLSIATVSPPRTSQSVALAMSVAPGSTWHSRLGHCRSSTLRRLRSNKPVAFSDTFMHNCISCRLSKSQRLPFEHVLHKATSPLFLIHSDTWQFSIVSNLGFRYYVSFVDDFT